MDVDVDDLWAREEEEEGGSPASGSNEAPKVPKRLQGGSEETPGACSAKRSCLMLMLELVRSL